MQEAKINRYLVSQENNTCYINMITSKWLVGLVLAALVAMEVPYSRRKRKQKQLLK